MSGFTAEPLIPAALWVVLAAISAGTLAWYFWRKPAAFSQRRWTAIAALAVTATVLVLWVLLNPLWQEPVPPPAGKPLLTILLDRSASMGMNDVPGGNSRLARVAQLAAEMAEPLARDFDVQIRTFAATTKPSSLAELKSLAPAGETTDLAQAVSESLDGERLQGQALLLLSDGIHNGPGDSGRVLASVSAARAMAVPIYTIALGGNAGLKDLELGLGRQQELAFVGQQTPLRVTLRQRGQLAAEAQVVLSHEGKELSRQTVKLPPSGGATTEFQVSQPATGLYRYDVRVEPLPGEATSENNSSIFVLRTIDHPIRVLLLEGKPYWDAKFLLRTLAHDSALEVDGVVRVADDRYIARSLRLGKQSAGEKTPGALREETSEVLTELPPALRDAEKLAGYQVLVLGRDADAFLTDDVLERVRTWISKEGGALVCYRGAPVGNMNQKLARLMPVRWSRSAEARFRVSLTAPGEELNWITGPAANEAAGLARMPSLATTARPEKPAPLAVVLAHAENNQPVVTYQPYGTGRVVAIEGAGMWRWAFLAPAYQQKEPVYDSLWQGLMRWLISGAGLAPGQAAALRADRITFFTEESAAATLLVRDESTAAALGEIELKDAHGKPMGRFKPAPSGDEPGVYRVLFGPLPAGQYTASTGNPRNDSGLHLAFDVRASAAERLDVAARPELLARMATESGGAALEGAASSELASRFVEHLAQSRPAQIRQIPLWDKYWVLATIIGCWGLAWILRRRGGLI